MKEPPDRSSAGSAEYGPVVVPDIEAQRRYWEEHWLDAKSLTPWALERARFLIDMLAGLRLQEPRLLDLGCGTGWFAEQLAHLGPTTAIDLSDRAIAAARLRAPHIAWIAGDLFKVTLPADSFDVVVSQQVIAHVLDQEAYVAYAARVLRPRGFLILTTPNKRLIERLQWHPEPHGHIEHWLTLGDVKRLLRRHFVVLQATSIQFLGHHGILRLANSYKLNRILSAIIPRQTLDRLKGRAGLGYTLVVLAQKPDSPVPR